MWAACCGDRTNSLWFNSSMFGWIQGACDEANSAHMPKINPPIKFFGSLITMTSWRFPSYPSRHIHFSAICPKIFTQLDKYTDTLTQTHTHTHAHTHIFAYTVSLSLSFSLPLSHTYTHTYTHFCIHSLSLSLPPSLSLSNTHTHTHTQLPHDVGWQPAGFYLSLASRWEPYAGAVQL